MKLTRRRKVFVFALLLALLMVAFLGTYRYGLFSGMDWKLEDPRFVDPWIQDIAKQKVLDGSLDEVGYQFEVEGFLKGYVVFGISSPSNLVAVKVDGSGRVIWAYRFNSRGLLTDVRQLSSGNFLIQVSRNGVYEISPEGDLVWYHLDGTGSHHAQRLENGNTVICQTERSRCYEITLGKSIVWEWDARREIEQLGLSTYVGYSDIQSKDPMSSSYADYRELMYGRRDWTHINTAFRTLQGTTLLSLRNLDLIVEVDKDNNVLWTFGALVLKHPHTATRLLNGNTLIFDNGNGRVVEVSPSHEIVWEYGGLYSPIMGGVQRLPSGDTLITESNTGVLLVVSPEGRTLWTLKVPKDSSTWGLDRSKISGIYRAWWYPN